MSRNRYQQAMIDAEEATLLVISRLEKLRALENDETDILERIMQKRRRRDYNRARRSGRPRALFRWTEEITAELAQCQTRKDRKAFSEKYRVSLGAMTLQRHRMTCNGSGGHGEGV